MRSAVINIEYWDNQCEQIFEGLDMTNKPAAKASTYSLGGYNTQGTNIFFTNGSEDPW